MTVKKFTQDPNNKGSINPLSNLAVETLNTNTGLVNNASNSFANSLNIPKLNPTNTASSSSDTASTPNGTHITFNPDKTVTVQVNGKDANTVSKNQFNASQPGEISTGLKQDQTSQSLAQDQLPSAAPPSPQSIQQAQQVGQQIQTQPSDVQGQGLDFSQALGSGAIQAATGSAALGLGAGALSGGTLAVPGAIVGAVGGFVRGVVSNIQKQLNEQSRAEALTVNKAGINLRALVSDTNQHPENAAQNLELFNYQLALLDREHSKLYLDTRRNLNRWLGVDGTTQLQRFELFNAPGGTRQFLTQRMQEALLNPDPTKNYTTLSDVQDTTDLTQ
jgi:hypothetical protein